MKDARLLDLGFSRTYEFSGVILECDDHLDLFTGYKYETDGCFGCEYLDNNLSISTCSKGYKVKKLYLRKDDNNKFVRVCTNRTFGSWGKSKLDCADCMRSYGSMAMTKCRLKYNVKKEIVKIGINSKQKK